MRLAIFVMVVMILSMFPVFSSIASKDFTIDWLASTSVSIALPDSREVADPVVCRVGRLRGHARHRLHGFGEFLRRRVDLPARSAHLVGGRRLLGNRRLDLTNRVRGHAGASRHLVAGP